MRVALRGLSLMIVVPLLAWAGTQLRQAGAQPAGRSITSGYAIDDERCGTDTQAFPKLRIGMRPGYCAGLAASKDDGLIFPRSIVQVPGSRLFVVADMGGWAAGLGRLLLLDPAAPEGRRIKVLVRGLDLPHGLAVGIDRRVYAGTADKVFRFDPLAARPEATIEVILQGLPGRAPALSDGTKLPSNTHPLKHFVFDPTGRIFVNVGAPTDSCAGGVVQSKPCAAGEGAAPLGAVWAFTPPKGGVFPALRPGAPNPPREVYGRGLRNSMALAVHPRFPDEGYVLQAENARDLPDPFEPNEELNVLEPGKHHGWPYCYDLATASPEYKAFLQTSTAYKDLCGGNALYRPPHTLLPPHAAPLAMLYYEGSKFPELRGKLIVGLHGYRPTGSRVIVYDVDQKGLPEIKPAPVRYNVSCAAQPTHAFETAPGRQVPAAPFTELIADWHKVNGVRPQGAPVGMTVAADGAIWLVEDKNQTILRVDVEPASAAVGALPCDARTPAQITELVRLATRDAENRRRLAQIRSGLVERHCKGCHSDLDLKPGMTDAGKDETVLRFLLAQDGWVYPGDPEAGRLHARVWGKGAEQVMPPNGRDLIANEPGYKDLLATLDAFVARMVPGERRRVVVRRGVAVTLKNRANRACGSLPNSTLVVVIDSKPTEKPGFGRIYRPADKHLNGACSDGDGYYVPNGNLGGL